MMCRITSSVLRRASDVTDLAPEEAADLVERAPHALVLGVFSNFEDVAGICWAHVLRGDSRRVEDADELQRALVLELANSAVSLATALECERREAVRSGWPRPARLSQN